MPVVFGLSEGMETRKAAVRGLPGYLPGVHAQAHPCTFKQWADSGTNALMLGGLAHCCIKGGTCLKMSTVREAERVVFPCTPAQGPERESLSWKATGFHIHIYMG